MVEIYQVIVWDKQADDPYCKLMYNEVEVAQQVARNMKKHYVDDWGLHGETIYEVRLQKILVEEDND